MIEKKGLFGGEVDIFLYITRKKSALSALLSDEQMSIDVGKRAKALMMQNSGALDKMMSLISSHLK